MTGDNESTNDPETGLTREEYLALQPLIDKKIITTMELPTGELSTLFTEKIEAETIRSATIQLQSGKITGELDSPQKISTRYAHEFMDEEVTNKSIHQGIYFSLSLIKLYFGMDWFVDTVAKQLADRHEMTELQAKALLHKLLGYPMDSTDRSHLYQLRQKIIKYKPLIENFEALLLRPTAPDNYVDELKTGHINLSKTPNPARKQYYSDPEIDALPVTVRDNMARSDVLKEQTYAINYSCNECDFGHRIVFDTKEQELPQMTHHGRQMRMVLVQVKN